MYLCFYEKHKTVISSGDFSPYDYDRHDYAVPRFVIKNEIDKEIDFEELLVTTIKFWENLLIELY